MNRLTWATKAFAVRRGGPILIVVIAAAVLVAQQVSAGPQLSAPHRRRQLLAPFGHRQRGRHRAGELLGAAGRTCAQQSPAPVALLGRLAPGHSAAELSATGYDVAALMVPRQDMVITGTVARAAVAAAVTGPLVVIHAPVTPVSAVQQPVTGAGVQAPEAPMPPDPVFALRRNPALQATGYLYAQSSDPNLRSCNYQLTDSPGAQALLRPAVAALLAQGLVTQAQLDAGSTTYMIGEDPLESGHELITVLLAKPAYVGDVSVLSPDPAHPSPSDPVPSVSQTLTPVVASVDRATGQVESVGYGNWYLGQ